MIQSLLQGQHAKREGEAVLFRRQAHARRILWLSDPADGGLVDSRFEFTSNTVQYFKGKETTGTGDTALHPPPLLLLLRFLASAPVVAEREGEREGEAGRLP